VLPGNTALVKKKLTMPERVRPSTSAIASSAANAEAGNESVTFFVFAGRLALLGVFMGARVTLGNTTVNNYFIFFSHPFTLVHTRIIC
jgi:hypothetical protein